MPIRGVPDSFLALCQDFERIEKDVLDIISERVAAAMTDRGEDPENFALLALRVHQFAYGLESTTRRLKEQAMLRARGEQS